jgi:hypothetical protein
MVNRILYISLLILFASCNKESAPDCFKKAGEIALVRRNLSAFDKLELQDYLYIELIQSEEHAVEIKGPQNLLSKIETYVDNGVLYISNGNTCNFVRSFKNDIIVKIYSPNINDIQNRGTGDITTPDTLYYPYLKIENRHAAGTVRINIIGDSLDAYTQTGVADFILNGQVLKAELFNQGVGRIDARGLKSHQTYINNSSVNDISAYCTGYLFAINYFSGNIYVTGNPDDQDLVREGTGTISVE